MIFKGDLSRYHPADALMFLSHLNLNGILSIAENDRIITLTFKDGMLQNAHSLRGDRMMMRCLRFQELISAPQLRRIQQIQAETGMSVSQILGQLKLFPLAQIETILQTGVQEVLLELFLLENGAFNFTDTPVDSELPGSCGETSKVVLQVSAQADEFLDFQKSVMSLDRSVRLNHHKPGANLPTDAQIVLKLAGKDFTLRQIIDNAPLGSYRVIKSVQKLLDRGNSSTRSYFLKNRQAMGVWGQILWQHAIECGLGARRIASATGFHDPEEAFIGGVMHDIGKLVLLLISAESFREVQKLCKMRRTDERSIERQIMGGDHEQIGRLLMNKWNMPEPVKMCVEFHHRYVEADQFAPLVSIVTYADHLSHQYGAHPRELLEDDLKTGLSQKWMEQLNLSEQQHNLLLETIINDYRNAEVIE